MQVGDLVKRKDQSESWMGIITDIFNACNGREIVIKIKWNVPYLDPYVNRRNLEKIL